MLGLERREAAQGMRRKGALLSSEGAIVLVEGLESAMMIGSWKGQVVEAKGCRQGRKLRLERLE